MSPLRRASVCATVCGSGRVHYQDAFVTLYHHLGIDARNTTIADTTGRPHTLLDVGEPIAELI